MTPCAAHGVRLEIQRARENALKDAKAFEGIIQAVERLGSFCLGRVGDLGKYWVEVSKVAALSPLAAEVPACWPSMHKPFCLLYDMVRDARNDAVHIGASARHLTTDAIALALVLEDALRTIEQCKNVSDYMVRDPVCAHLWEPVSLLRQRMLSNSFSFLPVQNAHKQWCLLSDLELVQYLLRESPGGRKERLATPLEEATKTGIELSRAKALTGETPVGDALKDKWDGTPILVFRDGDHTELVGILTAFDLL